MKELRTEIQIDAAGDAVWATLMDFERYPEWNPFVRSISGETRIGSPLTVHIKPEGGMGMTLYPSVVTSEANRAFAWKGKLGISGLFDGRHEFIIEPNGGKGVRFVHREEFTGILVPLLWPMLEKNTRRGFEEMNAALKKRAEAGQE